MFENKYKQIINSEYISLYDKIIPKDHLLRQIKENIDFSFVNKLVEKEYSENFGRPATEPEVIFKLLFLQTKDFLSDREVIQRAKTDMAYKFFLDLNPEDDVPSPSLLSIFRNTRIKDEKILEEMLSETVRQAIEKGIIKSNSIIVDSAHTNSKNERKTPTQILRELTKNLRKEIYRTTPELKEIIPNKLEETATLQEEIEYTKELLKVIKENMTDTTSERVKKRYKKVEEMLKSERIEQIRSAVDKDARTGYKSEDNDFFGYKNHVAMTEERIVTALEITSGEAPDGKYLPNLSEKSKKAGIEVKEIIGDTAYSNRDSLIYAKKEGIKIISKLNPIVSKGNKKKNDGFEYIKDADTLRCPMGNLAMNKILVPGKTYKDGYRNPKMVYSFSMEDCRECPRRNECLGKTQDRGKRYSVKILTGVHKDQEEFQNTEYFKERLKTQRYKIEVKNAETKIIHGLAKAKSVGLAMMRVQSYLTHITVNIKRIITKLENLPA